MTQFFALLRLQLLSRFADLKPKNLKSALREKRGRTVGVAIAFIFLFIYLGVILYIIETKALDFLMSANMADVLLVMAVVLSTAGTLVMAFFFIMSSLYLGRDAVFLASMPIGTRTLLSAKLAQVWISETLIDAVIILPAGILYGSTVAAPYVGAVMETILPHLGIEPVYSAEELENRTVTAPDCRNLKREDAVNACRKNGLEIVTVGEGELVTAQSPTPETVMEKENGKIILYFGQSPPLHSVTVPNVVGKTPKEANQMLIDAGLNISVRGLRNHAGSEGVSVIAQSIPPGSEVPRGTVVEITLRSLTDEDLDES